MTLALKTLSLGSLLLVLAGCGTKAASGGDSNGFTDQCKQFQSCSEQCFCTYNDIAKCGDICSAMAGSGGSTDVASGGASSSSGGDGTASGGSVVTGSGGTTDVASGGSTQASSGGSTAGSGGASSGGTTGSGGTTSIGPATEEFDITTSKFDVPVGGNDVYKCQTFKNPNADDVAILESDSFMSAGSHHMFVFHGAAYNHDGAMTDSNTDLSCSGITFDDYLHLAQTPQATNVYPPGVGRLLKAGEGLSIVVHYINLTEANITGQVQVKFHYVPKNQVTYLAEEIFLNKAALVVPLNTSTQTASYITPFSMKVLSAVSHMHSRGVGFSAKTNTGLTLYQGTQWDEPKPATYPTGLDVPAGTNITWSCSYDNETGNILTFGEHATTNEMCIMFGTFYTTDMANQGVPMNDAVSF